MRAANLLAEKAVNVRSEAREAYLAYRGTWDIARHYEATVLPLRKQIQDEALLQYSGMLVDVTSLVADVRARIMAQAQAIDARRDFWIAEAELRAANNALVAAGPDGLIHPSFSGPYAHMNLDHYYASWFERFARSFSGTIAGGTSEIQRNIIAQQVLGLPRG